MIHPHFKKHFYGTTTVGEKGQVVIPVEARSKMKLKKGEKLLAFGLDKEIIVLSKLSNLEKIASHLSERLKFLKAVMKKTK